MVTSDSCPFLGNFQAIRTFKWVILQNVAHWDLWPWWYVAGSTINLWCEGKGPTDRSDCASEQPPSKKLKSNPTDTPVSFRRSVLTCLHLSFGYGQSWSEVVGMMIMNHPLTYLSLLMDLFLWEKKGESHWCSYWCGYNSCKMLQSDTNTVSSHIHRLKQTKFVVELILLSLYSFIVIVERIWRGQGAMY